MRFFFDTDDGTFFVRDELGAELASVEAARQEAIATASGMARDLFTSGTGTRVVVGVRDGTTSHFEVEVSLRLRTPPP
jgi:flavin-binding protein dodecin